MRICRLTLTTWAFNGFLCTTFGKLEATAAPLISTWQKFRQVERILQKPHSPYGQSISRPGWPDSSSLEWKVFAAPTLSTFSTVLCHLFARPTCWRTTWDAAATRRRSQSDICIAFGHTRIPSEGWGHRNCERERAKRTQRCRRVLLKYLSCSNAQKVRNCNAQSLPNRGAAAHKYALPVLELSLKGEGHRQPSELPGMAKTTVPNWRTF